MRLYYKLSEKQNGKVKVSLAVDKWQETFCIHTVLCVYILQANTSHKCADNDLPP